VTLDMSVEFLKVGLPGKDAFQPVAAQTKNRRICRNPQNPCRSRIMPYLHSMRRQPAKGT
ncbi:MAG: hypothetical protein ACK4HG_08380, partial [Agrobacterium albertimagni]